MVSDRYANFKPETIAFLNALKKNNNRNWFNENKSRYEEQVLDVVLYFIQFMQGPLKEIAPHFTAILKRVNGSLMRVYRDTHFSKNKLPYKTNIGIQFRHEQAEHGDEVKHMDALVNPAALVYFRDLAELATE